MKTHEQAAQERLDIIVKKRTAKLIKEINERKRIEEDLKKSVEKYRSLASATDSMYIVDRESRFQFVNDGELTRLGCSQDKVIGKAYSDFHSKEDARIFSENVNKALETNQSFQAEHKSDKDARIFLRSFTPVVDSLGIPCAVTVVSKDITKLKQSEEKAKALLKEKEVMLREIYHRVKNNMQVISSLLNLQADRYIGTETYTALKESQRRIRAMSLVHEKLYKSTDFNCIDCADYLQSLSSSLSLAFQIDPTRIQFDVILEHQCMNVSDAIPCALIINELISNSMKHAFPDNRKGTITVEFHHKKDDATKVELIVRDDGVGFPLESDIEKMDTLGLEIVRLLTEQMNGTLEIESDKGTTCRITFKAPN
jgi:PAS domain S-box-containing protein